MPKTKSLVTLVAALLILIPITPASANADCYAPGPSMDLSHCNFVGIDLSGYDLSYSNLTGANLTNTDLSGANLTGVRAEKIVGVPVALPEGWVQIKRFLLGPTADLTSMTFNNLDFSDLNLQGADFTSSTLTNVVLANTDLTDAGLDAVSGSALTGEPKALPAAWTLREGFLLGPTANLSSLTLTDIDFTTVDISQATFSQATIVRGNLSGIDFQNISMDSATVIDSDISDANFEAVDLSGLHTSGLIGLPNTLPDGWELFNGFLIGPGANLTGEDFTNTDFTAINLAGVILQDANLTGADLTGVDLTSTVISGATLTEANIEGTDLTGVDLTGVTSALLKGTPIGLDENWTLFNGFLIGPGANLSAYDWSGLDLRNFELGGVSFVGGNLSRANLAGMDLSGINLTGANLTGANLTKTILTDATLDQIRARDIIGKPIDVPEPFLFTHGFILGPTANLDSADLTGLSLKQIDLTGASLKQAKLKNADLRGATLTGTAVDGADFTGAKLLQVISGEITGTPAALPSNFTFSKGTFKVILVLTPTPKLNGLGKVATTMTVTAGTWDEGVALTYQWSLNGTAIVGARSKSYNIALADFKKNLTVTVTGTGTGGTNKAMTSLPFNVAAGTMVTKEVKITGTFGKGKTLTAPALLWIAGAKISYSWLQDGKPIKKANKSTYKILPKQAGKKISVMVTQTADGYETATVTSKATKVK